MPRPPPTPALQGAPPAVGDEFRCPALARGLRAIAATRGEAFYRGEVAEAIAAFVSSHGGALTVADLAAYTPEWVTPLTQSYHDGYVLHELPPNGQGMVALIALGIIKHFDLRQWPVDSPETQHVLIEAVKLAFADVYQYVADPSPPVAAGEGETTPRGMAAGIAAALLNEEYLARRAAMIDVNRAQAYNAGDPQGGTVYLTVADSRGMMVSFIQSNFMGFGSGCAEPTFGVSLQNRGHAFSLAAGPNQVGPGQRPFHTIIPAFVTRHGEPVMSFGVMGANMQPQGHVQTLVRMIDFGQSPQAACDAPRWRWNRGLALNVEPHWPPATIAGLRARGHEIEELHDAYQDFGAGQFIWKLPGRGYVAASDPRRDGQAVGF